jgi:transposase-like protein
LQPDPVGQAQPDHSLTPSVRSNVDYYSYKRHRFLPKIIAHAVWLYFRFPLSLRLVEEMLLERGIVVSYETVRRWALKFGPAYARRLRRKTPSRRDVWHLDEVVVTIAGQKHWLWRAVDQDGYVLDEIVQSRRDAKAAKRLLRRLLKQQGCPPRRMITDKLGSYAAAQRQIMPDVEHRSHKGLLYSAGFSQALPICLAPYHGCPAGSRFSPESARRLFHYGVRRMRRNDLNSVLCA